jgi:O-antigen/teichoic acid export membrane protein
MAPASLGLALTAQGVATTMLGVEYRATAIALIPWMAAAAFLASVRANYLENAFHLSRRTGLLIWVALINAISATTFSLLLIPRMGPLGAAISITVALAISCCHAAIAGRSVFRMPIPISSAIRVLICCGSMTLIILLIRSTGPMAFVMQILLGGLGYSGTAMALNLLDIRTHLSSYIRRRRRVRTSGS